MKKSPETPVSHFPIPADRTVLIDLDGTLIDRNYLTTDSAINNAITRAQSANFRLALSSDSALESMLAWGSRLGMDNRIVIAERGALVKVDDRLLFDESETVAFTKTKNAVRKKLSASKIQVWTGDAPEMIRRREQVGQAGASVVLLNGLRRFSLGLYAREVAAGGHLEINNALTNEIFRQVQPLLPDFDDLNIDLNHDYGILIVSRKSTTKRAGTQRLMHLHGWNQVGMIGDSMTDHLGQDIALHYAVGNAKEEFKKAADYISPQSYTTGVVDILDKLSG